MNYFLYKLKKRVILLVVLPVIQLSANTVRADIDTGYLTLNMHGEVYNPACYVNFGNNIDVKFGTVVTNQSDMEEAKVDYTLSCDGVSSSDSIMLSANGRLASFDPDSATAVTNELPDVGIKLFMDGKPMVFGMKNKISMSALPNLTVKILKKDLNANNTGHFSAVITLSSTYN